MSKGPVIAVIGAGFSGTLTALHLLHSGPPSARILLIEASAGFGRGLAYAAHNPNHLLNVRVGNMSAFPDDSDHLKRWLAARPGAQAVGEADFITRGTYGDYLAALIQTAIAKPDGAERLVLVADRAVDIDLTPTGANLRLAMGRTSPVDAVVLAIGNLPPQSPGGAGLEALPRRLYAANPWAPDALADIAPDETVLLLGAGLTMIDIALDLVARGHQGPIIALSRRGLAPHRHAPMAPFVPRPQAPGPQALSERLRERRLRAAEVGWRAAVDELRPVTAELWRGASRDQKRRFLRHLRPWWDIHRHRMAPTVAEAVDRLRVGGRLTIQAGRLVGALDEADHALVQWRPRGGRDLKTLRVARIVNCTGVGGNLARTSDPLLLRLLDKGAIRADPLGLGLEVDAASRVISRDGAPSGRLFAAGPLTQGYSWEAVAVPDIRNQVTRLARTVTAALNDADRPATANPHPPTTPSMIKTEG